MVSAHLGWSTTSNRPVRPAACTVGTPAIGCGSSTPLRMMRSLPPRSVTSIPPSGRNARDHGADAWRSLRRISVLPLGRLDSLSGGTAGIPFGAAGSRNGLLRGGPGRCSKLMALKAKPELNITIAPPTGLVISSTDDSGETATSGQNRDLQTADSADPRQRPMTCAAGDLRRDNGRKRRWSDSTRLTSSADAASTAVSVLLMGHM